MIHTTDFFKQNMKTEQIKKYKNKIIFTSFHPIERGTRKIKVMFLDLGFMLGKILL